MSYRVAERALLRGDSPRITVLQDDKHVNHCGRCGGSLPVGNMPPRCVAVATKREARIPCHDCGVNFSSDLVWLTVPDVCERLDLSPGKVHRLVEERQLLGIKLEGAYRIPELFLDGGEPLGDLRGTLLVLLDGGFSQDSALHWLLTHDEVLGVAPIAAIRAGRKTEVRRLAHTLAL